MLYQYRYFNCIRKKDDVYKIIAEDVEARFDTSNYELDRRLPQQKNKKVIGLMKEELSHKIMTKFVGLRAKAYSFLMKNINMKLIEKQQKYKHFHMKKLVTMNILQVKKYCLLMKDK